MNHYTLIKDGDEYERECWEKFIKDEFPSYEKFWIQYIVPLTNRPENIYFKTNKELQKIGKSGHDICLAQLHYSILYHLGKVYKLKNKEPFALDDLTEGIVRICGALDIAFEFLERFKNPKKYSPWLEKEQRGKLGSMEARKAWQKTNGYPLQNLRNYRNHLVHGRMMPNLNRQVLYLPKVGLEKRYFDWRLVTSPDKLPKVQKDFIPAKEILSESWNRLLDYLETNWKNVILHRKT